ncbi:F-box/LRR-repeat protein 17 isoform X3 [Malaclemys terrapin pileata]|uniref:F-box/LRR-repeat protein 17 isoform X3 n=1 Tax=Malaclemys terrapin pileata TaxID=2991368 RepID=UPI0023A88362|nr:F-box/LRR-repeat protein 17 isoform X3 [Malaclemys terrapin pileata]
MGHLLSREGTSLSRERSRLRRRGRKVPPRSRSCFLRGPCMLCFIVHGASPPAPEQPPPGRDSPPLCTALSSPEQRAARRLLHLSPAAWEQRGPCQRLLLSRLLPPPVRAFLGSARPPGEPPAPDMVCKRKGAGLPACPPCKQPRCGAAAPPEPEAAACQCPSEQQLCPLPCASDRAAGGGGPLPGAAAGESGGVGELAAELPPQEEEEGNEPDRQEPLENPSECCRESLQLPPPDINQLPPSILLKEPACFAEGLIGSLSIANPGGSLTLCLQIFSNLSLNERCLSASLVCKYWRDLCLDFQFWKQLDLSNRQQVTDELLEKIASRSQNISEINISDCRNVSDTGVCVLAFKCPGLLRYTAYRCKQLSDTSIIAVASQCPLLQKVHVGNQDRLTDEGLKQLGSKCKELKDIHFGQCYKISDEGMIIIAKGCLKLQRIYMQENKLVTDHSVKAFAEHCPELQYVGFMGCSVTSKGVIHLTNLRNLSSLDLRHITELDNETVMEIVKRCKNLSSLNLCLNWIINDRCVEVIAKEGQNLKELYLVSCKITDYALIAIGRYSMTIETVDVGWCKEITDQGATQIAQSSKSLRYLGLMRCDKENLTLGKRLSSW